MGAGIREQIQEVPIAPQEDDSIPDDIFLDSIKSILVSTAAQPGLLCVHSKTIWDALRERPQLKGEILEHIDPQNFFQFKDLWFQTLQALKFPPPQEICGYADSIITAVLILMKADVERNTDVFLTDFQQHYEMHMGTGAFQKIQTCDGAMWKTLFGGVSALANVIFIQGYPDFDKENYFSIGSIALYWAWKNQAVFTKGVLENQPDAEYKLHNHFDEDYSETFVYIDNTGNVYTVSSPDFYSKVSESTADGDI